MGYTKLLTVTSLVSALAMAGAASAAPHKRTAKKPASTKQVRALPAKKSARKVVVNMAPLKPVATIAAHTKLPKATGVKYTQTSTRPLMQQSATDSRSTFSPETSSKAKISEAKMEAAPKRWGLLIDSWNETVVGNLHMANADENVPQVANNAMLIRPSYKITDSASVALGFEFNHDYATHKHNGTAAVTDPYLQVAHSNLGSYGMFKTKGYLRAYAPLSLASLNDVTGRWAALRAQYNMILTPVKNLNLSYNLEPRYFFQKSFSYEKTPGKGDWTVMEQGRIKHWLGVDVNVSRVGLYQNVGLKSQWFHHDQDAVTGQSVSSDQRNNLYLETGLYVSATDEFTITGGVYTEIRDLSKSDGASIYRDDESLYFLDFTLAL